MNKIKPNKDNDKKYFMELKKNKKEILNKNNISDEINYEEEFEYFTE